MKDPEKIERIEKGIIRIKEKALDLSEKDFAKFSQDLRQMHDDLSRLGELVDDYIRDAKESKAKKAISSMLRQGISFSRIEIDNMNFLINETGEIRRCFGLYKELDEFPRGSGPPPTWPDQN